MKKLFALVFCTALTINIACASSLSSAVKSDLRATKNSVKNAIKTDIQNEKKARTSVATAKKQEKIAALDKKIAELNKQMNSIKNDKTITETERALKIAELEPRLNFYKKQRAALK